MMAVLNAEELKTEFLCEQLLVNKPGFQLIPLKGYILEVKTEHNYIKHYKQL